MENCGDSNIASTIKKTTTFLWYLPRNQISGRKGSTQRNEARELIVNEIDPSDTHKAKKQTKSGNLANSFEVIAREWIATNQKRGLSKNVVVTTTLVN